MAIWPALRPWRAVTLALVLWATVGYAPSAAARSPEYRQDTAQIRGRLVSAEGTPVAGATVRVAALGLEVVTDGDGRYALTAIPAGTYVLEFELRIYTTTVQAVASSDPQAEPLTTSVDWPLFFVESATVTAATRRPEAVISAPQAVNSVQEYEIEQQAPHGQLPRLLAGLTGIELVQSGLYDFNPNARGFNTMVNRRVLTRLDGRDPSVPILRGFQEWAAIPFGLDELRRVDFVRGPGSALYGAGAFNGVLDLETITPRESLGGKARLTIGGLSTQRFEVRHAAALGDDWYVKVGGGYQQNDDFAVSRDETVEYAPGQLPPDAIPIPISRNRLGFGQVRVDKHFGADSVATFEAGNAYVKGPITTTSAGRSQAGDVRRPFARFNLRVPHWQLNAYYTGRDARELISLSSGAAQMLDNYNLGFEAQGTWALGAEGAVVFGADVGKQHVDTRNEEGMHTIFADTENAGRVGVFGQIDYYLTTQLRALASLRWDASSLHDDQISPRVALVYGMTPQHAIRGNFSKGFQRPGMTEYFLRTSVLPPLDLSALEEFLEPALGGVPLDFGSVPVLGLGNEGLVVERIRSFELGYNGIFADQLFFNATYFNNHIEDFASNLLPNVGTSLGRLNEAFGPYAPPDALSDGQAALVLATLGASLPPEIFASMSNDENGVPIIALLSFTNSGAVDAQGIELGVKWGFRPRWRLDGNYTLFDFEIQDEAAETPIVPNTPGHRFNTALSYFTPRFDGSLRFRWADGFPWSSGLYVGPVLAYTVVDLDANFQLTEALEVGVGVANLFNDVHYEMFGGDLLRRRLLTHLTVDW